MASPTRLVSFPFVAAFRSVVAVVVIVLHVLRAAAGIVFGAGSAVTFEVDALVKNVATELTDAVNDVQSHLR